MTTTPSSESPPLEAFLRPAIEVSESGHNPPESTTALIAEHAPRVLEIPPEQLYDSLTAAFVGRHPDAAMQWLRDAGLLVQLLPELDATVSFSQEGGRRHKDVWEHTKTVVLQAVPQEAVRWGAVLHDIGKVPTRRFLGDGKVTFHGHAEVGVRMFRRGPAKRIAFPDAIGTRVEELIRYHLRPGQYDGSWTDSAVRRFARELGPILPDLFALSRADVTSKRPGKRRHCLNMITRLRDRIEKLEAEDRRPKVLPPGLGNLLREQLEALAEDGSIEGGRDAAYYVDVVRERALLQGLEIIEPGRAKHSGSTH
jgi:poly(A) polymerase